MQYTIYSHADTDGGISAGILSRFLKQRYGSKLKISIEPVQHGGANGEWFHNKISAPCAILDFSLHPSLLNDRFFLNIPENAPPCYWLDHHPTGATYPFLTPENASEVIPNATVVWDTNAISTPGLMRTHREKIDFPEDLLEEYANFIDMADIVDGALFATPEAAHDYSSVPIKLQTLFCSNHKVIDHKSLYVQLSRQVARSANVYDLLEADPVYEAIIQSHKLQHMELKRSYEKIICLDRRTSIADFSTDTSLYKGLGRFLPYYLYPESHYGLHIFPHNKRNDRFLITCGINPWNKPPEGELHLGDYFTKHFDGGGHSFVAGGRCPKSELKGKIATLLELLNEQPQTVAS